MTQFETVKARLVQLGVPAFAIEGCGVGFEDEAHVRWDDIPASAQVATDSVITFYLTDKGCSFSLRK